MENEQTQPRTLYRHPLAAVGGAMVIAGGFLFTVLLILDLSTAGENPYLEIVTFIAAPAIVVLGLMLFGLSAWLQVRAARRAGQSVRFNLRIDMSDPTYVKSLWMFLGLSAVLLVIAGYSGTRAFETMESVAFCGEACHAVMEPQYVTYHNSPHARVTCVDCHIGPGASFWVRSKIDGMRQLVAVARDSYDRPIPTPVHNLRPAQATCEGCHWPQQFYGSKLLQRTYYRSDEANSPWSIQLLVQIGGDNPRVPAEGGIHWHMLGENTIEYEAADAKRQTINWVKSTSRTGETTIYRNQDVDIDSSPEAPGGEVRHFDCMDCHNRPSHIFLPPAVSINLAMRARTISPELPYVRRVGLDLLNDEYADREEAQHAIATGLHEYYKSEYPEVAATHKQDIELATDTLSQIYSENFFPEMKTDYRARETNLSHFVNNGCFRCHNESMVDDQGRSPASTCNTCHLIVAQGPSESVADLETDLSGLEFEHPEDIDEAWREEKCTECHTPEDGY
ncbi:MAG: NapC/NirT family cytochrome c [Halioglobus sp.]|nr:NapC/NirT family cytochrome c [Halioglobus sp.]